MSVPVRLLALERAAQYVGWVKEDPPGSNHGRLIDKWCEQTNGIKGGYPWCAAFVYSMFLEVGLKVGVDGPAAVANWVAYADKTMQKRDRPLKGDAVCYSWHGPTPHPDDHIGFVEKVLALPWKRNGRRYFIRTVEGNTGDAVRRRWRWVDPSTVVFVRVRR